MSTPRFDERPPALQAVQTRPLFVMRLDVKPIEIVGQTGGALRRVGTGHRFPGGPVYSIFEVL
ncbi:hypothetical protein AB4Y42_27265 [Paraburkholderia sp. EG286B]|uniref:hypothetical protein n=1 Tax=Paraburkholderia sp. EG286B TaxID=3237011 RepID=UPI0034D30D96